MAYKKGYKAYKKGLVDQFGNTYEEGKIYSLKGDPKFRQSGFHFCDNLEDTLRYYDAMEEEVDICEVIGFGQIREYDDSYYGYTIYATDNIKVRRVLTRNEIIDYAVHLHDMQLYRFLMGFKLTPEEIDYLVSVNSTPKIQEYINYYQLGDKDAFKL